MLVMGRFIDKNFSEYSQPKVMAEFCRDKAQVHLFLLLFCWNRRVKGGQGKLYATNNNYFANYSTLHLFPSFLNGPLLLLKQVFSEIPCTEKLVF